MNFQEKDQRIEPPFSNWLKELSPPFQYDSKNGTLKKIWLTLRIQRIELFFSMTQRIVSFFFQCDSKNWTLFFECLNELNPFVDWLKELNPVFFNMTQKIELLKYDSKNWTFFFEYDSQNQGLIFSIWRKELNVTQCIESSFFNLTQRIEPFFFFSVWLEDLNFLLEMSHRIN